MKSPSLYLTSTVQPLSRSPPHATICKDVNQPTPKSPPLRQLESNNRQTRLELHVRILYWILIGIVLAVYGSSLKYA